ncbi:MAG: cation transporting ATPase C-terminal domain-containing protein, partial [Alphaproteobacteria bacterium]|nr:cation transporting ATPase C-terminal domain-containing protein [Alphaproteobacteria bacterium]
ALQLLWVNLIMDGPPALTLSLEPIRNSLMKNKPTPRNAHIVAKAMLARIIFNGIFISGIFMWQTSCNILDGSPEQKSTILFTLFVSFQLMNAFCCRELSHESIFRHFFDNKLMLIAFVATFLLQYVISQYGGYVFGTVPLEPELWIRILALSSSVVVASEFFKVLTAVYQKIHSNNVK